MGVGGWFLLGLRIGWSQSIYKYLFQLDGYGHDGCEHSGSRVVNVGSPAGSLHVFILVNQAVLP